MLSASFAFSFKGALIFSSMVIFAYFSPFIPFCISSIKSISMYWRGYDGLVDLGYEKHFRVNHGNNEFSDTKGNHINGIEGFMWLPLVSER